MKNTFTLLMLLSAGIFALTSCDNGNADVELIDSPPSIELMGAPAVVESGAPLQFTAMIVDGVSEDLSSSPLASYTYTMTDTATSTEILLENASISGREATVDVSIETGDIPNGNYLVSFTATDVAGLSSLEEFYTEVLECPDPANTIGIIGDATPGGWGEDTDMTQDGTNPFIWTITIELTDGEAKFRQDNDWPVNWGATDFPSGSGTQDGPNIPVSAGEYEVTLNTCTGAYSFEEVE